MKLNIRNYFTCYPSALKQALPPVPSYSEGRGGWLNTAWPVWNRQCRTRLRRNKPQPNSPHGPALWRCPWKMPAEAALLEVPDDASKFVVEVLRPTPFGHDHRRSSISVFSHALWSQSLKWSIPSSHREIQPRWNGPCPTHVCCR